MLQASDVLQADTLLTLDATVRYDSPRTQLRVITLSGTTGYDLTDYVEGLNWSSVNPGGDEQSGFTLKRKWFSGAPEISQGNLLFICSGVDVLFAGRIEENDRAVADTEQIGVTAYGLGIRLKDGQMREIYVDQDRSQWGDVSLNEKVALATASIDYGSFTWSSDYGGLACALPSSALVSKAIAEIQYIAPQDTTVGAVAFVGKDTNLPTGWEAPALFASDTDSYGTADIYATTFDGSLRLMQLSTAARRYVMWREYSSGNAVTPSPGANRTISQIAVYGNHGLTLADPGDGTPYGVYGGDVIRNIIGRADGISPDIIDAPPFIIPQLVFREGVTYEDAISQVNQLFSYDWGTFGPRSVFEHETDGYFSWKARDTATQHWYALRSECDDLQLNDETQALYDSVDVAYTDTQGQQQVITRTTSVGALADAGFSRRAKLDAGTMTASGAAALGDVFLTLTGQQPPARGSITLSGPITHYRRGKLPPHYLRADGSNIRVPDVLPSSDAVSLSSAAAPDRRTTFPIKRVSVDAAGNVPKVTVEVDQSNDLLSVLQARMGLASAILGL